MSDAKEAKPAGDAPAEPAKKKPPVKILGAVAVIMVVEGAAVFMVAKMTSPKPAGAETTLHVEATDADQTVEIPLVEDRFQNMQTGRVWVWDAEIVLKVRTKNQAFVEASLESRKAELKEGVSLIFRRAQHAHLKEPGLETLNRQIAAYLASVLGTDAEGQPRVERVVIPRCKGFPAD
jgi:flagellar basal body-associated protein FliL